MRNVESGSIIFKGKNITKESIRERIDDGMAHIPEDRHKRGLVLDYTMEDNMVLKLIEISHFLRMVYLIELKLLNMQKKL